jgi:hypothetical protein
MKKSGIMYIIPDFFIKTMSRNPERSCTGKYENDVSGITENICTAFLNKTVS